ncbi:hypothetical protein F5Y17DRAFT_18650 [Xylariaceae sp. FL0594]|nr:hypothetical protein F5Y17DRAFT_18650 [Xylariaceae sp. FL0594]
MAPSYPDGTSSASTTIKPAQNNNGNTPSPKDGEGEMQEIALQPMAPQPMNPNKPHPESELSLRGGDRGGCCPGRFCFCIPCPLPCDFCII